LASRFPDAISALTRAVRWSTREKPLYRAHLALARLGAGEKVPDLADIAEALAHAPCGQGYGRFVLGQIAFTRGDWVGARRHLEAFVKRSLGSRTALGIALEGEISMARQTLAKMANN
jgi:hypothetical protein